jgi:hypothetical protein
MANPTTNYGWPMPTSTDLVTDLPADFDAFGQPVDTTLKALNPETTLGDISYRSAVSNTNTRLAIGTAGQVLAVSGGVPAWTTTADVTPLTTKGDLFTFDTADARLGVGANGTVLTANSSEATGLEWAVPAGAKNFTLLNAGGTSLSGSSTTISGISGADQIFVMVQGASGSSASATISVKINNLETNQRSLGKTDIINSASNVNIVGDSRTTINLGALSSNAASQVNGVVNIFGCNTAGTKIYQYVGGASTGGGTAQENFVGGGRWDNAATVSSIVIAISTGSFDAGTVHVYTSA